MLPTAIGIPWCLQSHGHQSGQRERMRACPHLRKPAALLGRTPVACVLLQRPVGLSLSSEATPKSQTRTCSRRAAVAAAAGAVAAAPADSRQPGPSDTMEARLLCSSFLDEAINGSAAAEQQLAVVLLNWTLPELTPQLWRRATLRVCADGGANRLYDELPRMLPGSSAEAVRAQYVPTAIKGDLDSIRPDVCAFYQQHGVPVHDLSEDQDSTDLQKCIEFVRQQAQAQQIQLQHLTLVALGALGGRLDHTLSNLSTLHAYRDLHLVLLGDGNLARLVPAGRCVIRPNRQLEGPTCGLVPCTGPAVGSSRGLRWNLDNTPMAFGGLVSTSNIIAEDEIHVETDTDLVWTTRLRCGGGGGSGSNGSTGGGGAS